MEVLEHPSHQLAEEVEKSLKALGVDATWAPTADEGADGLLRVRWEGGQHAFLANVKRVARPADVKLAGPPRPGTIMLTEYITPMLADALEQSGWQGYADASGNVSLRAPGLLIRVTGKPPRRSEGPSRMLPFSKTGLPVTFAVLVAHERGEELTQRDLVRLTGSTSLGTVNRVLRALQDSGHREADGRLRRPAQLRDQWIAAYVTTQPEAWPDERFTSSRWTSPGDVLVADLPEGALIGSELAAARLGAPIRPATALVYCPPSSRKDLVLAGRLRRDPEGTITVRPAFWSPELVEGAPTAPPFLVRADLLLEDDPRLTEIARSWESAWNAWT